ncbi:MAG TPA: arginase [Candidatus Baltobacteraceae bacterium]|jgi:arginase
MTDLGSPARARVDIIGVPMDLGASRRGVDMGPYAVRYARLHDRLAALGVTEIEDHGNLHVPIREKAVQDDAHAKFFATIQAVCDELAGRVERAVRDGGFPIVLGGDHSIAMGTLAGLTRARGYAPGLVWIDAHSDINSPDTSPSGNVHGMPLWFVLEHGLADPARTVQIGLRDVDAHEKAILRRSGVRAFSMTDVDRLGMPRVMEEAIAIAGAGDRQMHVSFDMDGIDPSEAPGTGTPVKGGLSYREAHLAMEMLAESSRLGSIEMVEINPILDHRNQTAALAVGLICSGLGKSIL